MFEAATRNPPAQRSGRALDMGRIYDSAVELYSTHFTLFVLSVAAIVVPCTLLRALGYASSHTAGLVVTIIVDLVANVGSVAVVSIILRDMLEGEHPTVGRALRRTLGLLVPLSATFVIVFLTVVGGAILFIIPGLLFAVWFAFSLQVVVFEDVRYTAAMGRSRRLVLGQWWRVFGILVLANAILSVAGGASAALLTQFLGGGGVTLALVSGVVDIITGPLLALIQTVLFLDVRYRKQGADLRAAIEALPEP